MPTRQQFRANNLSEWSTALAAVVAPVPAVSMTWCGLEPIRDALAPFMGPARNHVMLPNGGGLDFEGVTLAAEAGCLGFAMQRQQHVVKPRSLTLEVFGDAPLESFLLLELDDLPSTGIERGQPGVSEEVFQHPPGSYVSRQVMDIGYLGHDRDGNEIPLPREGRAGTRWLSGKMLIVAKASIWNGDTGTYDGRHANMTSHAIRRVILKTLGSS